jgi:hypothetical protein
MIKAARDGDVVKVDALLASGASINAHYSGAWPCDTALFAAAYAGQNEVIRDLLKHGADLGPESVAYKVANALACAEVGHQSTTVKLLLAAGAKPDPNIMEAARDPQWGVSGTIRDMLERAYSAQAAEPAAVAAPAPVAAPAVDAEDAAVASAAPRPNDFALVIGVEDYQSLPQAQYGVRDAESARQRFAALGIPERNIVALEGSAATGSRIRSYLQEWLPINVGPDATLWVYYSGHGSPDPKNGDAYLVPWDGDPAFLKTTAYPLRQFYADLGKTKAKRIVVALDSCFSGAGGRSVIAEGTRPLVSKVDEAVLDGGRLTVFAAASGDETTGTIAAQGHGAFTYYFLKGLSGAAKNADGAVTPKSLFDYLKPRVQDEAHRQNREQTPVLLGAGATDPL